VAAGLSWSQPKGLSLLSNNEVRLEDGDTDRTQLLTFTKLDYQLTSDLQLFAKYRYSKSWDRDTDETGARFEERSIGVAYRPVRSDRFNALGRYTRLLDLDPLTESRAPRTDRTWDVLSVETAFQINSRLEWVSKEAWRALKERLADFPKVESDTYLIIQRFNYNFYKPFELGLEYRILGQDQADDQRQGWLTEFSWRLQRHVRLGVGYNFTSFSDNEFSTNDYDVHGWFLRVQGRY
jgi:hypothetical protein